MYDGGWNEGWGPPMTSTAPQSWGRRDAGVDSIRGGSLEMSLARTPEVYHADRMQGEGG